MPRSIACDYCGDDIEPGTGTMFVRVNGQTVHFCSSKCEKNADLGREARDLEWTEAGRSTQGGAAEPTSPGADDAETEHRDTDIEDQGQAVDAVDDVDADLASVEPDEEVEPDADEGEEASDEPSANDPGDGSDTGEVEDSEESESEEETEEAQA